MDHTKIGRAILELRKEKNLTQQQLADKLHISNKTVSKWECGNGAPDVSLWEDLSAILGADIQKLLQGELQPNQKDVGKMDKLRFYVCPLCGNILTSTSKATISCCGRHLSPSSPLAHDEDHQITIEELDEDYYITIHHDMSKTHHIAFAAYVYNDRMWFQRLYPEQNPTFHLPLLRNSGTLYLYCTKHGLFCYTRHTFAATSR